MLPKGTQHQRNQIYHITFEDYLQPRKQQFQKYNKNVLFTYKPHPQLQKAIFKAKANQKRNQDKRLRLKLLEHPVLVSYDAQSKWQKFYKKLKAQLFPKNGKIKIEKFMKPRENSVSSINSQDEISSKTKSIAMKWCKNARLHIAIQQGQIPKKFLKLPSFLAFLRARNDDVLCKRKTGFEIYCEMASVHGFKNFVGATTWQRAFWCTIVFLAMLFSALVLIASHYMNVNTPTILYTESTTYPIWTIPFPAVTICNINRISRQKAENVVKKFQLQSKSNLSTFQFSLFSSAHLNDSKDNAQLLQTFLNTNNYTLSQLSRDISPDCQTEFVKCKWKGLSQDCNQLFQKIDTPHGICCAFNYFGITETIINKTKTDIEHISSCGPKTGLSIVLEPKILDYMASLTKASTGYQIFIHDSMTYPGIGVQNYLLSATTESTISITPRITYATDFVRGLDLHSRRCYFTDERQLFHFRTYTQENCLAECRSKMFNARCGCVPLPWPRIDEWPECQLSQRDCIIENENISSQVVIEQNQNYKFNHYAENFICDCYPLCQFNQYQSVIDSATLKTNFDRKDIKMNDTIIVNVFFRDLTAERLRKDVLENWLSFVGTFGGITGLYMGYSFVSGFEMIFFVFVRPACNWLTRKQIHYKLKRRQKKIAAQKAKQKKAEQQQK